MNNVHRLQGPARTATPDHPPDDPDGPVQVIGRRAPLGLPCHRHDPDMWFAESPVTLEHAKALCRTCPVRTMCLADALQRGEPWGVWGGEILIGGEIVAYKRSRGRPRKNPLPTPSWDEPIPESA